MDVDYLLEHYSKCIKALPDHPNVWMECFQAKTNWRAKSISTCIPQTKRDRPC